MKQWKALGTLGQLSWPGLPGVGQLAGGFSPSPLALGVEAGVEKRARGREIRGRREGVGGTRRTKGAVESKVVGPR